jgi:glucose-6-phosphate isomerase
VQLALYNDRASGSTASCFERFTKERVLERLREIDARARQGGLAALDASDPLVAIGVETNAAGEVTKNSYGVLNLSWQAQIHPEWPEQVMAEVGEIRARLEQTHKTKLRYLIWAGMGGSIEDKSMYNAAGLLKRNPRCYALDSTDPAKLKCLLDDMAARSGQRLPALLRSTLVVGMAMGMTSYEPVVNLEKLSNLYQKSGIDAQPNFLYMTLPDSLLDRFARERGYRKVELQLDNENSTAGRHSAPLTRGSLYPLALAGVDLKSWIAGTLLSDEEIHTAWKLASFLHAQGAAGRDKVTLALPKDWAGAALWTKQDFEESLGKSEAIGLKIVIQEKIKLANYRAPKDTQQDRVFLSVQIKGAANPDTAKTTLLRRAGYPAATLTLAAGAPLSRYMQFVHYTVCGLGVLRNMNFVTQPSVELYKAITGRVYAEARKADSVEKSRAWQAMTRSPRKAVWRGALTLYYDQIDFNADGAEAASIYASLLRRLASNRQIEYGELTFFGDTRYCDKGRNVRKSLDRAAELLFRARLSMPADIYEGPAMNHSYHEMVIGHGKCFSTVLYSEKQEQLVAAGYTADYHTAQFLATKLALEERGRAVVAIVLKDLSEKSLAALDEFFHQAANHVKNGKV